MTAETIRAVLVGLAVVAVVGTVIGAVFYWLRPGKAGDE